MNRLDIMIPHPLANLFDPQPVVEAEAETAAQEAGAGDPEEAGEPLRSILVLGEDEDRLQIAKGLAPSGLNLIDGPLGGDLQGLCSQGDVRVAVIALRHTTDRDLAICTKVVPLLGKGGVILCSPEWTRSSVLKALKAGAKGILMQPYESQELNTKVGKVLNPF